MERILCVAYVNAVDPNNRLCPSKVEWLGRTLLCVTIKARYTNDIQNEIGQAIPKQSNYYWNTMTSRAKESARDSHYIGVFYDVKFIRMQFS